MIRTSADHITYNNMGMTSALHITHSIIVIVTFADYITLNTMGMTSVDYITQHLESSDVNIISFIFSTSRRLFTM